MQGLVGDEIKATEKITLHVNDIKKDENAPDTSDEVVQSSGDYRVSFDFGADGANDGNRLRLEKDQSGEATYGTWAVNERGVMSYTPHADIDFDGETAVTESFDVKVTDGRGGSLTQSVSVTIHAALHLSGDKNAREDSPFHAEGTATLHEGLRHIAHDVFIAKFEEGKDDKGQKLTADRTEFDGKYGTLFMQLDGTWRYEVDNEDEDVDALHGRKGEDGHNLTESFTLLYRHAGKEKTISEITLSLVIDGSTDFRLPQDENASEYWDWRYGFNYRSRSEDMTLHGQDEAPEGYDRTIWLLGGRGDDVLLGGAGDDALVGWSGDDVLYGGAGDDVLHGSWGDDVLYGGAGNDRLYGQDGDDIFVLGTADEGRDVVADFSFGTASGYHWYDGTEEGGNDKIRVQTRTGGGDRFGRAEKSRANTLDAR